MKERDKEKEDVRLMNKIRVGPFPTALGLGTQFNQPMSKEKRECNK